jgi:hypothetical protein
VEEEEKGVVGGRTILFPIDIGRYKALRPAQLRGSSPLWEYVLSYE